MPHLLELLDHSTKELFKDLQSDFEIIFQPQPVEHCSVYSFDRKAIITYNPKDVDSESITHELLHVWLKRFQYGISNQIFHSFFVFESLKEVFTKELCDHIGNCMDHNKMYPIYKSMGYSDEKFLLNGIDFKCTISDLNLIQLNYLGKYSINDTNQFIGHLISILADHYPNNYSKHFSILKNKDSDLFEIVFQFWNEWVKFDITTNDPIFNSDRDIGNSFISKIEQWAEKKIFTF
jgi:hypothetical protein